MSGPWPTGAEASRSGAAVAGEPVPRNAGRRDPAGRRPGSGLRDPGRGTRAVVDRSAFAHNLGVVRAGVGDAKVMAVVKANAYGHGLEAVVAALAGVDGLAVATVSEAERVRANGPRHPILLLEGILHPDDVAAAAELDLWIAVHSQWQIDLLAEAPAARALARGHGRDQGGEAGPFRVWLKVDTGMHRLGFRAEDAGQALARLRALPQVHPDIVLMSHLANADEPEDPKTRRQLDRLAALQGQLGLARASLANSAGALAWPGTGLDWVRCGLALYGASPVAGRTAADLALRPAMTLESTLIAINRCHAGDAIGYGGTFRCPEPMPVGIVGIGYGDGYPRHAGNGTPVAVFAAGGDDGRVVGRSAGGTGEASVGDVGSGRFGGWPGREGDHDVAPIQPVLCPLVGRVSMDMLAVDLRAVPHARVGDRVQLWGDQVPIEHVAAAADTIAYELLCGITARVPLVVTQDRR